ncbi:MAG: spore coat protein [Lachnospiraceae bacterium]|nr:spore coat protein [Lachnospiraceae bacterium]
MMEFKEKEILGDALVAQKNATNLYNNFSNECVHEGLRSTLLDLLADEHSMQQDVFCSMHERGYYPTPEAQQNKIDEAKQKFSAAFKAV